MRGIPLGEVAKGSSNQITVPANTDIPANTHRIAIYSKNADGISTAGRIITFTDVQ